MKKKSKLMRRHRSASVTIEVARQNSKKRSVEAPKSGRKTFISKTLDRGGEKPTLATSANLECLLIGRGRLAKHLKFFLPQLLQDPAARRSFKIRQWNRGESAEKLDQWIERSERIFLAIPDSALEEFVSGVSTRNPQALHSKIWVHFSGSLSIPQLRSAHPLMSFGPRLYPLATYRKIHWTCESPWTLNDCIPGLKNSWSAIEASQKSLYHAACVMMGNLPVYWWTQAEEIFNELEVPKTARDLYLDQVIQNWRLLGPAALTGPLARRDVKSLLNHLIALHGRPVQQALVGIYESFLREKI